MKSRLFQELTATDLTKHRMVTDVFWNSYDSDWQDSDGFRTEIQVVLFEGPTRIERKIETRNLKPVSLEDRIKVHQAQANCEDTTTDNGEKERNDFEETFSFGVDEGGNQEGHDSNKGIFPISPFDKTSVFNGWSCKSKTNNDNHRSNDNGRKQFVNPASACYFNPCSD